MSIPRNEYPRPQLVRNNWLNLNGQWDFEIDDACVGVDKKYYLRSSLEGKITVPFCPESKLSGVGHKDFMNCVWYRKSLDLPESYKGKNIILHFGAVDYRSLIYVNGTLAKEHIGGYSSFSVDITKYLMDEGNYITVCAFDCTKTRKIPSGKQSPRLESFGCYYTRTTGIWQTVWLEAVGENYIKNVFTDVNIDEPSVTFRIKLGKAVSGYEVSAIVTYEGKEMGKGSVKAYGEDALMTVALSEKHLWEVGKGRLYDVKFTVTKDGKAVDAADSYFGLRTVSLSDNAFMINGKTVFGRWVLDQGFYPDGIYTAKDDDELKADIEYSMALGFNGARLHEKVFEERFLYHADKMGYLVWGEYPNWGLDHTCEDAIYIMMPEWLEVLERDYSHPSIIGWCPLNETWRRDNRLQDDRFLAAIYDATKAFDKTRPCIDSSGSHHVKTDIWDYHDYIQSAEGLNEHLCDLDKGHVKDHLYRTHPDLIEKYKYTGGPFFNSEYGGIRWDVENDIASWGYGDAPKTEEEFLARYKELTEYLLYNKLFCAFCYTQLYDVEQEKNGLLTYDRKFKFDPEIIKAINSQKAAIEE